MSPEKYTAFLADDSEDDRFFLRKALERSPRLQVIGEALDGEEVLEYLKGEGSFSDRQRFCLPDVLLLDIKMPRKNGFDVLEWLKTQSFDRMMVVMVSGSWLAEDIAKSFSLGAHAYFNKTPVRKEQDEMVRSIEELLDKRAI